jgi:hypothetical protein
MAALQYINAVWSLVAIYWVVGMVLAKPTIKRELPKRSSCASSFPRNMRSIVNGSGG